MKLPATATLAQASAVLRDLQAALAGGDSRIDASALTAFDTSVVAVLLEAQRLAAARGTALQVDGAPSQLRALAELYGVDALLSLAGTA